MYGAFIFLMMIPRVAWSEQHSRAGTLPEYLQQERKKQGKRQDGKKQDDKSLRGRDHNRGKSDKNKNREPDQEDIIEVPKARKQARPGVVNKPAAKVKPIKVARPKIKKP